VRNVVTSPNEVPGERRSRSMSFGVLTKFRSKLSYREGNAWVPSRLITFTLLKPLQMCKITIPFWKVKYPSLMMFSEERIRKDRAKLRKDLINRIKEIKDVEFVLIPRWVSHRFCLRNEFAQN